MAKILLIALVLMVLACSGCVINQDYTGVYVGVTDTVTLFEDGAFMSQGGEINFSGTYTITNDTIHLMHPLMAVSFHINESGMYDDKGHAWVKQ